MSLWRTCSAIKSVFGLGASLTGTIPSTNNVISYVRKKYLPSMQIIDSIEEFKQPYVRMKDPQHVDDLISKLIKDGKNNLQVVADFDYTLSRFHQNGTKCETCHGALMYSQFLEKKYADESKLLYNIYHPVELNVGMTLEEKAPYMNEWWEKSHDIFARCQMNKNVLPKVLNGSNVVLRSGADWFLNALNESEIPLLVLSAGLGDLVTEAIKQQGALSDNVTVIANFMNFDENGYITGFKSPIIHCCNKNVNTIRHEGYFEKVNHRPNVIVVGDSLGDLTMVDGADDLATVIKIGFLNEKVEEALPKYMAGFDIVLIDDQSLNVVNALLRRIL